MRSGGWWAGYLTERREDLIKRGLKGKHLSLMILARQVLSYLNYQSYPLKLPILSIKATNLYNEQDFKNP
jgi:hypothetical protein